MKNETFKLKVCFYSTIALFLLIGLSNCYAQRQVSVSIHQDFKLGVLGDKEHGYKAGTVDILARFKMQGHQQKYGYMIMFPEFEYAEIQGIYKRYSVNAGYTFNRLLVKNFEVSAALGYGWIDRYGKSMFSFGGSGEIAYKINDLKISVIGQLTERKDLAWLYGKNEIRFSGFIGLEYNLN